MKKIYIFLAAFVIQITALQAADLTGVKIYINPGHGGYDGANDRNVETIPYALGDTLGFWESWSNLRKGLALRDRLVASGATVIMSRTQNRDEDDRLLSEIAEEANTNDVDAFLSSKMGRARPPPEEGQGHRADSPVSFAKSFPPCEVNQSLPPY